jgi:hypothetical protein
MSLTSMAEEILREHILDRRARPLVLSGVLGLGIFWVQGWMRQLSGRELITDGLPLLWAALPVAAGGMLCVWRNRLVRRTPRGRYLTAAGWILAALGAGTGGAALWLATPGEIGDGQLRVLVAAFVPRNDISASEASTITHQIRDELEQAAQEGMPLEVVTTSLPIGGPTEAARTARARRWGNRRLSTAHLVVWGEVMRIDKELVIRPRITVATRPRIRRSEAAAARLPDFSVYLPAGGPFIGGDIRQPRKYEGQAPPAIRAAATARVAHVSAFVSGLISFERGDFADAYNRFVPLGLPEARYMAALSRVRLAWGPYHDVPDSAAAAARAEHFAQAGTLLDQMLAEPSADRLLRLEPLYWYVRLLRVQLNLDARAGSTARWADLWHADSALHVMAETAERRGDPAGAGLANYHAARLLWVALHNSQMRADRQVIRQLAWEHLDRSDALLGDVVRPDRNALSLLLRADLLVPAPADSAGPSSWAAAASAYERARRAFARMGSPYGEAWAHYQHGEVLESAARNPGENLRRSLDAAHRSYQDCFQRSRRLGAEAVPLARSCAWAAARVLHELGHQARADEQGTHWGPGLELATMALAVPGLPPEDEANVRVLRGILAQDVAQVNDAGGMRYLDQADSMFASTLQRHGGVLTLADSLYIHARQVQSLTIRGGMQTGAPRDALLREARSGLADIERRAARLTEPRTQVITGDTEGQIALVASRLRPPRPGDARAPRAP